MTPVCELVKLIDRHCIQHYLCLLGEHSALLAVNTRWRQLSAVGHRGSLAAVPHIWNSLCDDIVSAESRVVLTSAT